MASGSQKKQRDVLKSYYGIEQESKTLCSGIYDLNGPEFDVNIYIKKMLKDSSLNQLIENENEMVSQIQSLDNEMQTLVYENYNKFINATDTIRKMKNDFKEMEDGMDKLTKNMSTITDISLNISGTLQLRRQEISKLTQVHTLLKKLQFLFEMPSHLQKCIDDKNYRLAVRYYTGALKVLNQYSHMPSLGGIHKDCQKIIEQLNIELRNNLTSRESNTKQLCECVELLLKLNQPSESLCDEYLFNANKKLNEDLEGLDLQLQITSVCSADESTVPLDILAFIDLGSNSFISNLCLVVASYNDMFLNRLQDDKQLDAIAVKKLSDFVNSLIEKYFKCVQARFKAEKNSGDNKILVRSLDRFFRRLHVLNKLVIDTTVTEMANDIVIQVAKDRTNHYYQALCKHFSDGLTDIRQSLVSFKSGSLKQQHSGEAAITLASLLNNFQSSIIDHIKSIINCLVVFLDNDLSFSSHEYFKENFSSIDVRENLLISFFKFIINTVQEFTESCLDKAVTPSLVILIMSRLLINFEQSTIRYLLTVLEEQLPIQNKLCITDINELCRKSRSTAKILLNHYVKLQGSTLSQMLRKSVETRDCLSCIEPRSVKAVMKRVVEDIVSMDSCVGELYEEGSKTERTSDSTRHSYSGSKHGTAKMGSQWSHKSNMDNSLLSNIQKLFSDKIDIFTPVTFSRASVLTGIIKISLKTLLECVRLKTFGRYGLQQIQVDTYYLQLHLWRFVSDENIVHAMLDEIMSSAVHRCIDPTTMEASVVDLICERS